MTPRDLLCAALPAWALVIETGLAAAPFVGFHRFGNRVFATTVEVTHVGADGSCSADAPQAMAQLVEQVAGGRFESFGTHCTVTVFDDERDAATFMRDVRRLSRRAGNVVTRDECEVPV